MIVASTIFTSIRSFLDDDNSDRYKEATDLVPAVNAAINWIVSVFNAGFDAKKISPESLKDLIKILIVSTTDATNSVKADITSIANNLWTILGVDPDPSESAGTYIDSKERFAKRMTIEEWGEGIEDPFSSGTMVAIPIAFRKAAYLTPGRYLDANNLILFIRPKSVVSSGKIAVWYLTNPTTVTSSSSNIELPASLSNLIVQKSLEYMSFQHGPESKLGSVTDKDIVQLVSLLRV